MKKKTTAQLKKDLDKIFSQFVRQSNADENGMVDCYTCSKRLHWKEMQCGHFVSRQHLATRYSEDNCRPQCVGCNVFGGGKVSVFAERLEKELGVGTVARLYREANQIVKDFPYEAKIEEYENKLTAL